MYLTEEMKKQIKKILSKHKIKKAGIFGSYVKGKANNDSDLDLIVELVNNDLFELISLKNDIEEELNISVDIITYDGLIEFAKKEQFKKEVLQEQEILL